MRILANYMLKVGKDNYGSEQYMVTVEAESEFNNIAAITDYLFGEARSAVERQINGTAVSGSPSTTIPAPDHTQTDPASEKPETEQKTPKSEEKSNGNGGGNGNALPATDKQVQMLKRLLKENFRDAAEAKKWLTEHAGSDKTTSLTRKVASRTIEALMDRKRSA